MGTESLMKAVNNVNKSLCKIQVKYTRFLMYKKQQEKGEVIGITLILILIFSPPISMLLHSIRNFYEPRHIRSR